MPHVHPSRSKMPAAVNRSAVAAPRLRASRFCQLALRRSSHTGASSRPSARAARRQCIEHMPFARCGRPHPSTSHDLPAASAVARLRHTSEQYTWARDLAGENTAPHRRHPRTTAALVSALSARRRAFSASRRRARSDRDLQRREQYVARGPVVAFGGTGPEQTGHVTQSARGASWVSKEPTPVRPLPECLPPPPYRAPSPAVSRVSGSPLPPGGLGWCWSSVVQASRRESCETRAPLRPPAARLHGVHSGPVQRVRSSVCPRSQACPVMRVPQRAQ